MTSQKPDKGGLTTRRKLLVTSGTTGLALTAGCTAVADFIGDQLLKQVNVFNETSQPVTGSIVIVDPAGDTALDQEYDLAPSDSENNDERSVAVYDDVWGKTGAYEVTVELADVEANGKSRASETVTIDDSDEQMLAIELGSENIGFHVGKSLSDFE